MQRLSLTKILRVSFVALISSALWLTPSVARAVNAAPYIVSEDAGDSVTSNAAVRARADVQIRRIRSMIVTKETDSDADYSRLERFQKQLRGER